jgi:hypothetical protein
LAGLRAAAQTIHADQDVHEKIGGHPANVSAIAAYRVRCRLTQLQGDPASDSLTLTTRTSTATSSSRMPGFAYPTISSSNPSSRFPSKTAPTSSGDDSRPPSSATPILRPSETSIAPHEDSKAKSIPIAAIVGGVGGAVVLVALGVFLFVCLRRRRHKKKIYQAPIYVSPYSTDSNSPSTTSSYPELKMRRSWGEIQRQDLGGVGLGIGVGHSSVRCFSELPAEPIQRGL